MISTIATYLPAWVNDVGQRALGPDEDVATVAVAAGLLTGVTEGLVDNVALVTQNPQLTEGFPYGVIRKGLGLSDAVSVSLLLGGASQALDVLVDARPRSLVITVDDGTPAAAGAILFGDGPAVLRFAGRIDSSLPVSVRRIGDGSAREYDDKRLVRERGWRPAVDELAAGRNVPTLVAGLLKADIKRLDAELEASPVDVLGASASVFAVATLVENETPGRVISLTQASATACDVIGENGWPRVVRQARGPLSGSQRPQMRGRPVDIPFSMPAYERAWEAKVGFLGGRCTCGTWSYPPRRVCLECGSEDMQSLEPLPRTGEVYTIVTVHTPVPGVPGPYDLAIITLDGTDVRVLARVTDAPAERVAIGTRGKLVLRRVAVREGVPDYGYGFLPGQVEIAEVA